MHTHLAGPMAPSAGIFPEGKRGKGRFAIFGLREEKTLQARLRDYLFPQTSEPEPRFCLFSLRRPLAAETFLSLVVQTMRSTEGFERSGIQEKMHFYNIAHASNGEVRSLTYVIEDNYPSCSAQAAVLRESAMRAGSILAGLIRSTESRRSK